MQLRSLISELAFLPLSHKLAAVLIPIGIIAGAAVIGERLPEVYTSAALISMHSSDQDGKADGLAAGNEGAAVSLARSLVARSTVEGKPRKGDRLDVAMVSKNELRITGRATDAAEARAMTQAAAATLTAMGGLEGRASATEAEETPDLSGLNADGIANTSNADTSSSAGAGSRPDVAGVPAIYDKSGPSQVRPRHGSRNLALLKKAAYRKGPARGEVMSRGREEFLLRATIAALDSRAEILRAEQRNVVRETAGKMVPSSQKAVLDSIDNQLKILNTQRTIVDRRLKEEQESRASESAGGVIHLPIGEAQARDAGKNTSGQPFEINRPRHRSITFSLVQPARDASVEVSGWRWLGLRAGARSLTDLFGVLTGLLCGVLYVAIALKRFRPVADANALKLHLPGDVLFVGTIRGSNR